MLSFDRDIIIGLDSRPDPGANPEAGGVGVVGDIFTLRAH